MKNKILLLLLMLGMLPNFASAFLISDQGTNVREVATGNLTVSANLTIDIYDSLTGGTLIFEKNFSNAIANGSWNLMINPALEYGKSYWKDYQINGEDLDFDGLERLELQSSIGKINNISFINFSLIDSCSAGSSIRAVYENGSVVCETINSSANGTADGTGGWTNNSVITSTTLNVNTTGNLTVSNYGFFGWLGSLTSRITKLFAQDIDASGNVNVSGNVTASKYCNSTSCYSISEFLGSGSESDPIFVAENSTLWGAINNKLAETDQRYNDTVLILSMNTTSNIMSLSFYNKSEVDNLISSMSGGNSSWNQSGANLLYSEIKWGYNQTYSGSTYNETYAGLINNASYLSTYNATYAASIANNSWNQSGANLLYSEIKWGYNQTYSGSTYNETYAGLINNASYLSTYNATYAASIANNSWNQSGANLLYSEIKWGYNQTYSGSTYNETYAANIANNSWNQSGANLLYSEIKWGYNQTYSGSTYNETYAANIANNSWNQSGANLLYSEIKWGYNQTYSGSTYNETYAGLINNASYLSTYNETYAANIANNSWNQSGANLLYSEIKWGYNMTYSGSTYNETYAQYNDTSLINNVNTSLSSRIDGISGGNASWNQSGANLLYSEIKWGYNMTYSGSTYNETYAQYNDTSLINNVNTTLSSRIDGISGGNASWNQSGANLLYSEIKWGYNMTYSGSTYNATYAQYNDTSLITNVNTTLSSRIDGISGGNASWNQSFANTLYAPNTTAGIQSLLNSTGVYSTYNESYATWLGNYSIFTGLINNASYLSTYNSTYDAKVSAVNDGITLNAANITSGSIATLRVTNVTCSGAAVMQNYTSSGAQCITPTATESDPIWNGNYSIFTGLINNASYLSTYNETYAGLINNASYLSTYNATYADYVTANYTNKSNYWDNMGTINTTQMQDNGGILNILESWLYSLFYTESEVDTKLGTADLHTHNALNITSPFWVNKTGDTMTGNLNMGVKNLTSVDCIVFASGGKICSA